MRTKRSPRAPGAKRQILIIDDHSLVRRGLIALIDNEPDLTVCAEAAGYWTGLEAIALCKPNLVITDLSLGDGGDGLSLVQAIRSGHEDLPVLVLSMHDSPIFLERAFQAGANGYVTKQEMSETLLVAMRQVLGGARYVSPKMEARRDTK